MDVQRCTKKKEGGLMNNTEKYPDFMESTGFGKILGLCGV